MFNKKDNKLNKIYYFVFIDNYITNRKTNK
jgi:hypothetical protein